MCDEDKMASKPQKMGLMKAPAGLSLKGLNGLSSKKSNQTKKMSLANSKRKTLPPTVSDLIISPSEPVKISLQSEQFEKMEETILSEVGEIRNCILSLLEERKKLQQQHKEWINERKKKIFETKKETIYLQGHAQPYNTMYSALLSL